LCLLVVFLGDVDAGDAVEVRQGGHQEGLGEVLACRRGETCDRHAFGRVGARGHGRHGPAQRPDLRQERGEDTVPGGVVDAQRHLVSVGAHEDELDERRQQGDDDEVEGGAGDGEPPQSGPARHADRRGFPDGGGGREASDRAVSGQDDAGSEEADAGDDLGGDARGVVAGDAVHQDVGEAVLGDQHHEARRHADDGLGADARALASDLSFEADGGRQDEGEQHPADARKLVRHGPFFRWRGEGFSVAMRVRQVSAPRTVSFPSCRTRWVRVTKQGRGGDKPDRGAPRCVTSKVLTIQ